MRFYLIHSRIRQPHPEQHKETSMALMSCNTVVGLVDSEVKMLDLEEHPIVYL